MKCFIFTTAAMFHGVMIASAAEATPLNQTNFLEILKGGGIMMFPLALMSVICVVLILLFLITIRRNAIVSDRFMHAAESMIRKYDFLGLIALSKRRNECMARIVQKTLDFATTNPGTSFDNIRDVAQVEGSHQAGMLTSRVTYLADIGAIAPMVGLLGTVFGMIEAFMQISSGEVQGVREMGMAEGVSKALIATAGGLAISIPALAFYSIFRGRVQKYNSELEAAATYFIAMLHAQYERQPNQAAQASVPPAQQRGRDGFAMPPASPLLSERPDLHGI